MKKAYSICIICMLILCTAYFEMEAQEFSDSLDISIDTTENYSFFSASISYATNNISSVSNAYSETSASIADVSFNHKSGVMGGFMATRYNNVYDFNVSAGYTKFFNLGLDISANYTYHYAYGEDTLYSGIDYTHNFNVDLAYFAQNFYLFGNAYSLHGKTHNYFAEAGLGYDFTLNGIFTKDDYIDLFPMFSVSFGSDFYIYENFTFSEYYYAKKYMLTQGFRIENFEYQSFDIFLPLSYTFKDYTFSVTYMFTAPGKKFKTLGWENQSGILFSLLYMLAL